MPKREMDRMYKFVATWVQQRHPHGGGDDVAMHHGGSSRSRLSVVVDEFVKSKQSVIIDEVAKSNQSR